MKKLFVVLVLFTAINAGAQWVQVSSTSGSVKCFAISGTNIFAGIDGGVIKSTNNGTSWSIVGLRNKFVSSLAFSGTKLFAGTYSNGVFLSTNNGVNWNAAGLTDKDIHSFAVLGTNIFAGTTSYSGGGVYLSTNGGTSWNAVNNGLPEQDVNSIAVLGTNVFAGTWGAGVFLSTNNGTNWISRSENMANRWVLRLAVLGPNLFAGTASLTGGGLFLSSNNGINWNAVYNGIPNQDIYDLSVTGMNIVAGTYAGIFLSTNYGTSWINENQGFNTSQSVFAILVTSDYIFAGTNNSIWRRPYSEVVGVENSNSEIPSKYSLSQNYPNPFNPITNVKFSMLNERDVKLVVYDVQGREVQTLVNEKLSAGIYEVKFDGSMLNSGVYFYKMMTDGFTETKKMLLIK
jgi:hypothetical protein